MLVQRPFSCRALWCSSAGRAWMLIHHHLLCFLESFSLLTILLPPQSRAMIAHTLQMSLTILFSYLTWYFSWRTPLPVYILDRMNLRPFFLPNILCNDCNNFSYPLMVTNEDFCLDQDVFLLILVASFHANMNARQAIRQSWGSVHEYRGKNIKTLFMFGRHEDHNLNNQMLYELEHYGDVIQKDFREDYRTLTNKSMMALSWVRTFCPSARFILKTDDDAFNVPQRYVDYLLHVEQERFVGGYCFTVMPDRRDSSKFYVPESMFPDNYYPTYCSGPGYVLSRAAVDAILAVAPTVSFVPMEDVYVTGLCRVAAGIQYTQISGTAMDQSFMTPCNLATWVKNGHNIVPERTPLLWQRVVENQQSCVAWHSASVCCVAVFLAFWCRHLWALVKRPTA